MTTITPPRSHAAHLYKVESIEATRRISFSNRDLDYKMKMLQLTLLYRRPVSTAGGAKIMTSVPPTQRHSIANDMLMRAPELAAKGKCEPAHRPKILAVEPKIRSNPVISGGSGRNSPVKVSVKSATLPSVPQQNKVKRLVQFFEHSSNGGSTNLKSDPKTESVLRRPKPAQRSATSNRFSDIPRSSQPLTPPEPAQRLKVKRHSCVEGGHGTEPKPMQRLMLNGINYGREVNPKYVPNGSLFNNPSVVQKPKPSAKASVHEGVRHKEDRSSGSEDDEIRTILKQRRHVKQLCKFFEQKASH